MGSSSTGPVKWDSLGLFASTCWNIRKARNSKDFAGSTQEAGRISAKAEAEYSEYCQALEEDRDRWEVVREEEPHKWERPHQGTLNINIDVLLLKGEWVSLFEITQGPFWE